MKIFSNIICLFIAVAFLVAQLGGPLLHTHSAISETSHVAPQAHMHLLVDDYDGHAPMVQASLKADHHHSSADAHYLSVHAVASNPQSLKYISFSSAEPVILPNLPVVPIMAGLRHQPALPPPLESAGLDLAFGFYAQAPPIA